MPATGLSQVVKENCMKCKKKRKKSHENPSKIIRKECHKMEIPKKKKF